MTPTYPCRSCNNLVTVDGAYCPSCVKVWMDKRLQTRSTRELLVWLAKARRFGGYYDPSDGKSGGYSIEEIKKVLATRPHVKKAKGKNK